MKKWFEDYIKKISDANKKNFGSERLECCDVNKKSNGSKSTKSK
ncbi:LDCC motif putative metal-binding protein [Anaeromicrobium sediminis]|nr:LDCC motif putative metal-binding protein [Anaeromicrobium sediminis]